MSPLDSFLSVGGALRGKNVVFTSDDKSLVPLGRWKNDIHAFSEVPINPIPASKEPSIVCGTDSSCIKIAETEDGTLYAVKCGVVFCLSMQVCTASQDRATTILYNREYPFWFGS